MTKKKAVVQKRGRKKGTVKSTNNPNGRPKGFPNISTLYEMCLREGFDPVKEFIRLYDEYDDNDPKKAQMLMYVIQGLPKFKEIDVKEYLELLKLKELQNSVETSATTPKTASTLELMKIARDGSNI